MPGPAVEKLKDGEFKPTPSTFRNFISREPGAEFPPESGRYHLYIAYACPFASRCYMFLKLKGLEDVIGITVTKSRMEKTREDPADEHMGWAFAASPDEEAGAQSDTINGVKFIRDLYSLVDPSFAGRYTVPVLWDKKKKTIVNNESAEIIQMFNDEFNSFAKHPEVDLYPANLKKNIDEVNSWTFNSINSGVYRAGYATKQEPYDEAITDLFNALDKVEGILSTQKYIAGNELTEADVRLFVTFIRFDEVYVLVFKCNKRMLHEYPNIFNYTKDIYQIPGISDTVHMAHIKGSYYGSQPKLNKDGIIPHGPNIDYTAPHDRHRFTN